jgi:anti-sigma-K factor RskA
MNADRDYLAAGLALGGLSDSELAEAQRLADSDADFRSEVDAYAETMALMAEDEEPQEVSDKTREAILNIPSTHAQEPPGDHWLARTTPPVDPGPQDPAGPVGSESAAAAPSTSPSEHRQSQDHGDDGEGGERIDPGEPGDRRGNSRVSDIRDQRARRSRQRPWLPYAAAAAAVIVVGGFGVTIWQQTQHQNQLEEQLAATQQQLDESARLMEADDLRTSTADLPEGGSVTVLSSESEQLIRFSPHDVGDPPAGKSMQMWVIGDDGPESAGLMTDEPVTIAGREFSDGSLFGITVEPAGGSEQPTTDPIVALDL